MGNIKGSKRGTYKKGSFKTGEKIVRPPLTKQSIIDSAKKIIEPSIEENIIEKEINTTESTLDNVDLISNEILFTEKINEEKSPEEKEVINEREDHEKWMDEFVNADKAKIEEKVETELDEEEKERRKEEKRLRREEKKFLEEKNKKSSEEIIKENSAQLMNGSMIIMFCDFFFPSVMKFIFSKFLKNKYAKKVRHEDITLNEDQVTAISEVSDHAAKVIFEKVNPMVLFALSMSVMYATNLKMATSNLEHEAKEKLKDKK